MPTKLSRDIGNRKTQICPYSLGPYHELNILHKIVLLYLDAIMHKRLPEALEMMLHPNMGLTDRCQHLLFAASFCAPN
jgi:hypothetical protein